MYFSRKELAYEAQQLVLTLFQIRLAILQSFLSASEFATILQA
jgi:hypothetical protein